MRKSFMLLVLLVIPLAYATANGSQCGVVNGNLTLVQNINASGTCYVINTSNIVIDGAGFLVRGTDTGTGISSNASFSNITIKNLHIANFTIGINLTNAPNSTIFNNTINISVNNGRGIVLQNQSTSSNITQNTILTRGSNGYAIYLVNASGNTISGNNANTTGSSAHAVFGISGSSTNLIRQNVVAVSGSNAICVRLQSSSIRNIIDLNNLTAYGSGTSNGVFIIALENNVTSNRIETFSLTGGTGIDSSTGADQLVVINNTINATTIGIGITVAPNSTLQYNTIYMKNSGSSFSYGISLQYTNNTVVSDNTILSEHTSGTGVWSAQSASPFITATNSILRNNITMTGPDSYGVDLQGGIDTVLEDNRINSSSWLMRVLNTSTGTKFTNTIFNSTINFTTHSVDAVALKINASPPAPPDERSGPSVFLVLNHTSTLGGFIDFNLTLTDTEIENLSTSTIKLYRHNGSEWSVVENSTFVEITRTISSQNLTSTGTYGVFGENLTEETEESPSTPTRGGRSCCSGGQGLQVSNTLPSVAVERILSTSGKHTFSFGGQTHTLTIHIDGDSVTFTIRSDPITFTLAKGERHKADLDGDGSNDVEIMLLAIEKRNVRYTIRSLEREETPPPTEPKEAGREPQPVTDQPDPPAPADEQGVPESDEKSAAAPGETGSAEKLPIGLIAAILIVALLAVVIGRSSRRAS